MNEYFEINKYEHGNIKHYYIGLVISKDRPKYYLDNDIAEYLGLELETYCDYIIKNSKVYINDLNEIYFIEEKDAMNIIKWLESLLIARKLRGENIE
jgi:hypothetical protein